jgi:hypothetical protein
VQDPLTQEREAGPTIALSFDEFELVDEALCLSVGMRDSEPYKHGLFVAFKALGETLYFSESALGHLLLPVSQAMPFALAHDLPKRLNQHMQRRKLRTRLAQFLQIGTFICFEIIKGASNEPEGFSN